jgi:hypothetical protein
MNSDNLVPRAEDDIPASALDGLADELFAALDAEEVGEDGVVSPAPVN